MKPFIKWVDGKTQLLPHIKPLLPKNFNTYFEPFLGGGELFLDLKKTKAYLSDYNDELINTWQVIKDQLCYLLNYLKVHSVCHNRYYYDNIRKLKTRGLHPRPKSSKVYLSE